MQGCLDQVPAWWSPGAAVGSCPITTTICVTCSRQTCSRFMTTGATNSLVREVDPDPTQLGAHAVTASFVMPPSERTASPARRSVHGAAAAVSVRAAAFVAAAMAAATFGFASTSNGPARSCTPGVSPPRSWSVRAVRGRQSSVWQLVSQRSRTEPRAGRQRSRRRRPDSGRRVLFSSPRELEAQRIRLADRARGSRPRDPGACRGRRCRCRWRSQRG